MRYENKSYRSIKSDNKLGDVLLLLLTSSGLSRRYSEQRRCDEVTRAYTSGLKWIRNFSRILLLTFPRTGLRSSFCMPDIIKCTDQGIDPVILRSF